MSILVDPRLHRYIEESGFHLVPDPDAFGFRDSETQYYVRRSVDGYEVSEFQRDSLRVRWTSSETSAVDRWLIRILAATWRTAQHLPWFFLPVEIEDAPDSVTLRSSGRSGYSLAWSEDGRPCRADGLDEYDAVTVAHLLQWSMDEILAAVESDDGAPVWSR